MVTKEEFFKKIDDISNPIKSLSGKEYVEIKRNRNFCYGVRKDEKTSFEIDLDLLYKAYKENDVLKTTSKDLESFKKAQCCSPAIAILMATGLLKNGKTIK